MTTQTVPVDFSPDRSQLLSVIDQRLVEAREQSKLVAVIGIKIKRLRDVFIEYGYGESDLILNTYISRLRECLRDDDFSVQVGNDEFIIVLPGLKTPAQPLLAISKIQRICGETIDVDGVGVKLKQIFGTAIGPEDADSAADLLRCADMALRDAITGEQDAVRYQAPIPGVPSDSLQLEVELEAAIHNGTLRAHYQPIVDIETGEVAATEMMARWPVNHRYDLQPIDFVGIAENGGLSNPLTVWGLNNGLRECAEWQTVMPKVPVAINFSAAALADPHMSELVTSSLKLWDADPSRLTIEVTESAIMANPKASLETLNKFHDGGIRIAIDDFGTGYSSLAYLQKLPVDMLKIDRSFVINMTSNLANRRIVQTVIDLAHNFDLTVVAEGVEDDETMDTLTLMGCQWAQGFYLGKPMPSIELEAWLHESPWEVVDDAVTPAA